MQIEKLQHRMRYLMQLIERESTGVPGQLAKRLGISERMLYRYIADLKDSGKRVVFCRLRKTYKFSPD